MDNPVDDREQSNEPLAHRLRSAAIDRTATDSARVDDFVLDADGVIDLRDLERDPTGSSVADPAKALATIRGQLGDAHEVSDLYDESEPEPSRWRLGLRARQADAVPVEPVTRETEAVALVATRKTPVLPPLSRLAMVPLATETDTADIETAESVAAPPPSIAESIEPEVDLRDEDRPTADCPKCMGLGHRDLFDRFSQVEFYSCDNCMHMWQQDLG